MLTKAAIEEFQTIYRQKFGQDISLVEAEAKALALIRLYKAVLKPETNQQEKRKATL